MSVCSYIWDSREHLSNTAFLVELFGAVLEVLASVMIVTTFHKEWDEHRRKKVEFWFEVVFLIAALIVVVAIVSNRRIETLTEKEAIESGESLTNALHKVNKLEETLRPKSLPERIIGCLNEINPTIVSSLTNGRPLRVRGNVQESQKLAFDKLLSEPGASEYIKRLSEPNRIWSDAPDGTELGVDWFVSTNLIKPR